MVKSPLKVFQQKVQKLQVGFGCLCWTAVAFEAFTLVWEAAPTTSLFVIVAGWFIKEIIIENAVDWKLVSWISKMFELTSQSILLTCKGEPQCFSIYVYYTYSIYVYICIYVHIRLFSIIKMMKSKTETSCVFWGAGQQISKSKKKKDPVSPGNDCKLELLQKLPSRWLADSARGHTHTCTHTGVQGHISWL